jgi:hypothetical protein
MLRGWRDNSDGQRHKIGGESSTSGSLHRGRELHAASTASDAYAAFHADRCAARPGVRRRMVGISLRDNRPSVAIRPCIMKTAWIPAETFFHGRCDPTRMPRRGIPTGIYSDQSTSFTTPLPFTIPPITVPFVLFTTTAASFSATTMTMPIPMLNTWYISTGSTPPPF